MAAQEANQAANTAIATDYCREAKAKGADIALFPEMWNIGYTFFERGNEADYRKWLSHAIDQEAEYIRHFRRLARELDMAIGVTYLEKWVGAPRNTLGLIDRHGNIVLRYAKVHTCEFDLEAALTPGDDFYVGDLDTTQGSVKIGAMICFDREFPESARILMLKRAEIVLVPNSCGLAFNRLNQFKTRAYENMMGLAMTNYPAPKNNGNSIAVDGIAYGKDETERDMTLVHAGEGAGVFIAEFDLAALREYHRYEALGNAYRKPKTYAILTSREVQEPFSRPDSHR
jgi:predicted amidohydrolase